jgi:hypothetical protein
LKKELLFSEDRGILLSEALPCAAVAFASALLVSRLVRSSVSEVFSVYIDHTINFFEKKNKQPTPPALYQRKHDDLP